MLGFLETMLKYFPIKLQATLKFSSFLPQNSQLLFFFWGQHAQQELCAERLPLISPEGYSIQGHANFHLNE